MKTAPWAEAGQPERTTPNRVIERFVYGMKYRYPGDIRRDVFDRAA